MLGRNNQLHRAESFLGSYMTLSKSKNYPPLRDMKVHCHAHITPLVLVLSQIFSSPKCLMLIKTHFNITPPSTLRSPMWSPSFRFSGLHFHIHFSSSAHNTLKVSGEAHYEIVTVISTSTHRHNFLPTFNVKYISKVSIKVQIAWHNCNPLII
jgi:hypothetical protein